MYNITLVVTEWNGQFGDVDVDSGLLKPSISIRRYRSSWTCGTVVYLCSGM